MQGSGINPPPPLDFWRFLTDKEVLTVRGQSLDIAGRYQTRSNNNF